MMTVDRVWQIWTAKNDPNFNWSRLTGNDLHLIKWVEEAWAEA